MVELRQAEDLAHRLEDYLRALREGSAILSAEGIDALLDGTMMLEQVIGVRRSGGTFPDGASVAARIATLLKTPAAAAPSDATNASQGAAPQGAATRWRCTFVPSAELVGRGIRVDTVRERLAGSGQILDAVPRVTANGSIAFDFVLAAELDADVAASWAADGIEVAQVEAEAPSPAAPSRPIGRADRTSAAPRVAFSCEWISRGWTSSCETSAITE